MEGVVLVELQSGALHYTKSTSARFDSLHPKSDRLNLGSLMFALQNFAGDCIRTSTRLPPLRQNGKKRAPTQAYSANITMMATAQERILSAQILSKKLLMVLFTSPGFELNAARAFIRRLAYNYDHGESPDVRFPNRFNQIPRLFRDASTRTIEEELDRLLLQFAHSHLHSRTTSALQSGFVLFYYSDQLRYKAESSVTEETAAATALAFIQGSTAKGNPGQVTPRSASASVQPFTGDMPLARLQASVRSISVLAKLRQNMTQSQEGTGSTRSLKNLRSNAVMDQQEPHVVQRYLTLANAQQGGDTEDLTQYVAQGILDIVLPFIDSLVPLFCAPQRHKTVYQQREFAELKLFEWTHFPIKLTRTQQNQRVKQTPKLLDLRAWKRGSCLLLYPAIKGDFMGSSEQLRVGRATERAQVVALFDVIEPLIRGDVASCKAE